MIPRIFRKMIALVRRRRLDRELAEEMETHRALLAEHAGPEAARLMGNVTLAREDSREVWSFQRLEWIAQNARHALRGLRRSPVFTVVAIASLALGIGANTAIFSFVNAILLKRLPVPEPERLVTISLIERGQRGGVVWRLSDFEEVAKQTSTLDGIFGWFTRPVSLSAGDSAARWVNGEMVTGQYFRTMRVQPAAGRLFDDEDVRAAAGNPVCVLSYSLWQSDFAGRPDVVGCSILLNGHSYRVLGVTQRGYFGAALEQRFDVAVPATRVPDFMPAFAGDWLSRLSFMAPMARLKPGATREQAAKEINRTAHDWRSREIVFEDGSQGFNPTRSQFGKPALALMAVSGLVLLVACANLANLLLARSQARAKEFAMRLSLGASRGRLIRQLLVESLVLAVGGGAVGMALAFWISRTLIAFLNTAHAAPYALHLEPDFRVLAFSVLLSLATAILCGWAPAWQSTRIDAPVGRGLVRRGLVVSQIALSLMIVFAAGLLTQTLRSLATIDLGYQPDRVIALSVDPAASGHSSVEISAILDQILSHARELPGVKAASLGPNSDFALSMTVNVPGYAGKDNVVFFNFISPDYFATLGLPLFLGRDFDARDNWNSPHVAIVNDKFVRHYLNGRNPLGTKLTHPGGPLEIVGVVADRRDDIRKGARDNVYLSEKQSQTSGLVVLVRTAGNPQQVIPSLLGVVQRIDRRMPVYSIHTLDVQVAGSLSSEKMLGLLSSLFAALATLLAGIGLYGVLAYSVARRRREIGIRFAVGAQRRDVAGLFAREGLAVVLVGLAIGAPAALVSARALGSLLFGVTAGDPETLLGSIGVLALAAVLATGMPLVSAARVDPMTALRHE